MTTHSPPPGGPNGLRKRPNPGSIFSLVHSAFRPVEPRKSSSARLLRQIYYIETACLSQNELTRMFVSVNHRNSNSVSSALLMLSVRPASVALAGTRNTV